MNKSILIALPIFLLLNYMAVSENLPMFIDTASLLIVLGVAIAFALCGSGGWFSVSRLSNAAEGAVIAGWLGALYGSVIILGNPAPPLVSTTRPCFFNRPPKTSTDHQ